MLTIRLQRTGKKHQPLYRIVLAEKHKNPQKKFLEILGNYNPRNNEFLLKQPERVKYWLTQQIELSPTMHNLFVDNGLLEGESKTKAWQPKKKPAAESAPASTPAEVESKIEEVPAEAPAEPKAE